MEKARLEKVYTERIRPQLKADLGLKNPMEIPKILKVVVNVGVKEAISDSKILDQVRSVITAITGQKAIARKARKSNASFKLREGMPIGVMVTLRRQKMYEFLDRLISLALPRIRDFQGVSRNFDGRGGYNLGIKEWTIFPEIDFNVGQKVLGMNITIHTSAQEDAHGLRLLEQFGMPFKKTRSR